MQNLIARVYCPSAIILSWLAWLCRSTGRWSRPAFICVFDDFFEHFPTNGKRRYREHYASVKGLVPQDRLLEYHVSQGWTPMCDFLGHSEPAVDFPRENCGEATQQMIVNLMISEARKATLRIGLLLVCVFIIGALASLKWR